MAENVVLDSNKLQSQVISCLRFPLIVAVVLIHSKPGDLVFNGTPAFDQEFPIYESVRYFLSDIVCRIAVPAFFFISGFLFFFKTDNFTFSVYWSKIKKRCRTLLIPYLFWNLVIIALFWLSQTFLPELTSGKSLLVKEYSVLDWLRAFWNGNDGMPADYPLWFIRDLMVVVFCSPIIYLGVKYLRLFFIIPLGLLWLSGCWISVPGFSVDAFFFFSLGAYYGITKKQFIVDSDKLFPLSLAIYIILAVVMFVFKDSSLRFVSYMYKIGIVVGLSVAISTVSYGIRTHSWKGRPFLANSSFFIYAYHALPLAFVSKLLIKIVDVQSDILLALIYFVCPAIVILLGLFIYKILNSFFPKFTTVITGGR